MMQWVHCVLDWYGILNYACLLLMIRSAFPRKVSRGISCAGIVLSTVGYALCNGTLQFIGSTIGAPGAALYTIYLLLMVLCAWLYTHVCLKALDSQCVCSLLFFVSNVLLANAVAKVALADLPSTASVLSDLLAVVILCAFAYVYRLVTVPAKSNLSYSYWATISVTPVIMMVLTGLWAGEKQGNHFLATGIVLLTMDVLIYLLFMRLMKEMQTQVKLALDNQTLAFQIRQMDNVKVMLENTRAARHELRNNYFLIESMIREEKYNDALEYLHKVVEPSFARNETISTGNHFVDMLLSQKVDECRQRNVPTALNVLLPPKIAINQQMLCSLIFNLWDNAIEASEKVENPDIRFSMHEVKGYLAIEIRNKIEKSVLADNPKLHTSKRDNDNHGIGIKMIRQVVEYCDGDLQIFEENEHFVVSILLACKLRIRCHHRKGWQGG